MVSQRRKPELIKIRYGLEPVTSCCKTEWETFSYAVFLFCRQVLFQHRQALMEQLRVTEDPALVLHLIAVLLFQFSTHCMLHAPGRSVPQIINFLSGKIPEVPFQALQGEPAFFLWQLYLTLFVLHEAGIRVLHLWPLLYVQSAQVLCAGFQGSLCC